jgi:hypothetical protein
VADLSWSRYGGEDCIRIAGVRTGADVRVHPRLRGGVAGLPPTAGRTVTDGADRCFVPRFAFLDGTTYGVVVDGVESGALERPRIERPPTTEVLDIHPTATTVPRNLLRMYVTFSGPMSEGCAADHVRVVDEAANPIVGALLPAAYELWDAGRRRLTVLLDPARIKRGLLPHREVGYPLRPDTPFRLLVDVGFRDASGIPLRAPAERRYDVGDDERCRVAPEAWTLTVPPSDSVAPLEVAFDKPLDHGLLARCLHVVGPDGDRVDGTPDIGPEERSWRLAPSAPWRRGTHVLVVDPALEDLAGNSVSRVFDRDLTRPVDAPRDARPVTLTFNPR